VSELKAVHSISPSDGVILTIEEFLDRARHSQPRAVFLCMLCGDEYVRVSDGIDGRDVLWALERAKMALMNEQDDQT